MDEHYVWVLKYKLTSSEHTNISQVQGCIFWHYVSLSSFTNRWNIVISFLKIISKLSARKIDKYIFMYVWVLKYNLTGLSTLVYPKSRVMCWFSSISLQDYPALPKSGSATLVDCGSWCVDSQVKLHKFEHTNSIWKYTLYIYYLDICLVCSMAARCCTSRID